MFKCLYCRGSCIRKGFSGKARRYYCKSCMRYQQDRYTYKRYAPEIDDHIKRLNNLSMGINDIAAYLSMPSSVVIYRIRRIASTIRIPPLMESNQAYEVDEMRTYVGNKSNEVYIFYGINHETRSPTNLVVGSRTKANAELIIGPINDCCPKRICTDKLNIYPSLIKRGIHYTFKSQINRIERKNLTLRTRLKRLSRQTICYSKSMTMLESCLKIYFWG